ncbi:MAG TPA: anaerobic sulfatase maturase [Anaerolineae bacterium]|nr:anaerobic sulfatase maturase [Anaerolineae bacterium]
MVSIPNDAPPGFHLLAKPTGAICNLNCKYCFFLSKEELYPGSSFRMSDELLEIYIQQLLKSHRTPEVTVAWQGGEPTLMGLDFFRRSVEYVQEHRKPGQTVAYTMQTNGTRLDDEWCTFFKENNFLIGLSVDGPQEIHDTYRLNKGGQGTFKQVMRGWEVLKKHEVDFNILCTVHSANADHPVEVYRFFRDELGAQFIQFIPIIERTTPDTLPLANKGWGQTESGKRPLYTQDGYMVTHRSVKPKQYGGFLIGVFEEWARRDVGSVFVQIFDVSLANWHGEPGGVCIFQQTCGLALALEHTGDLYSCDHFVEPNYLLGNIQETPMLELVASDQQRQFGLDKRDKLPRYCRECEVRFACHGGCPRNRFIKTPDGEPGLNYLCAGYKLFFHHIDQPMRIMSDLLRQNRAPAEIMQWYRAQDLQRAQSFADAKPNDPCPCGSGKKFKQCHGRRGAGAPSGTQDDGIVIVR